MQEHNINAEYVRHFLMEIALEARNGTGSFIEPDPDLAIKAAAAVLRSLSGENDNIPLPKRVIDQLIIKAK